MIKKWIALALVCCFTTVIQTSAATTVVSVKDTIACTQWVEKQLKSMSLKQKIGQLFLYEADRATSVRNKEELRMMVKDIGVGGIAFSGDDLLKQIQLINYVHEFSVLSPMIVYHGDWQTVIRQSKIPAFPASKVLGCISNDATLYATGQEVARQCRLVGVNALLAQETHRFGDLPAVAAHKSEVYRKGLEDGGIMDVEMATMPTSQKGTSLFQQLTITPYSSAKSSAADEKQLVKSLQSGSDMLLLSHNLKRSLTAVLDAVKTGLLTEAQIEAKCRKILVNKFLMGWSEKFEPIPVSAIDRLNAPETRQLSNRLQEEAITVLKDADNMLPLDLSVSGNSLVTISENPSEAYPLYHTLREVMQVQWIPVHPDSLEQIAKRLTPAQRVIVSIHTEDTGRYDAFLSGLAQDKPLSLIMLTDAAQLAQLQHTYRHAATVVVGHNASEPVQEQIGRILVGKGIANGHLSVAVGQLIPAGTGVLVDPNHPRNYLPEDFGLKSDVLEQIDALAKEGINAGAFPGCHVLILKNGLPIYNKCFGQYTYTERDSVKEHTLFDLGELTESTATMLAVMTLYDEGKFGLTDAIGKYLPFLRGTNKEGLTISSLLYHESGLPESLPFYETAIDMKTVKGGMTRKTPDIHHRLQIDEKSYVNTSFRYDGQWVATSRDADHPLQVADSIFLRKDYRDVVLRQIANAPLKGKNYRYSSLNFILLGKVVEAVSGQSLDAYLEQNFYHPMGLTRTLFQPLTEFQKSDIAPTVAYDFLRPGVLRGFVYNDAAAFMGGVSGNAGLFSTTSEVAKIYQMLLNRGVLGDQRYLSRATCNLFLTTQSKSSRKGLGFDRANPASEQDNPCAPAAPASVFGHVGTTGTCVWADPDNELLFIFLSNRTYPNAYERTAIEQLKIRQRMQQTMYQAIIK